MPDKPAFANTAYTVFYANFAVNGVASVITILLMFSMWRAGRLKLNLYTKCVIQMTLFQLMYDIYLMDINSGTFTTGATQGYTSTPFVIEIGGLFGGGVGASVLSMMLLQKHDAAQSSLLGSPLTDEEDGHSHSRCGCQHPSSCMYYTKHDSYACGV
jgi:hypothetical protein